MAPVIAVYNYWRTVTNFGRCLSPLQVVAGRAKAHAAVHAEVVVDHRVVLGDRDERQRGRLLALDPARLLLVEDETQAAGFGGEDLALGIRRHIGHLLQLERALGPAIQVEILL